MATSEVRFSDVNQHIEPERSLDPVPQTSEHPERRNSITEEAEEGLKSLAITLQKSRLQAQRLENFAYEPVSLPASRVPSSSSESAGQNSSQSQSVNTSSRPTPPSSVIASPPLTPSGSGSHPQQQKPSITSTNLRNDPTPVTPQRSPSHDAPPTSIPETKPSAAAQARLPSAFGGAKPRSVAENSGAGQTHPRPAISTVFGDSQPASGDSSPVSTPGNSTPVGSQSPRIRANPNQVDPKFIFAGARDTPQNIPTSLPMPAFNGSPTTSKPDKRHSIFGGVKHEHEKHQGSMSDLKRFFKFGHKKDKEKDKNSNSRDKSPSRSSIRGSRSGTSTPPSRGSTVALPFAEDHGLESKYGKFGKVLGAGAGGSVRIMKRPTDGTTFAVKQFRDRHSYESEKEYAKKVTAEFCIGSTLHHGNIIETMDIVNEKGKWFEVMEFAPFDLFACVMTGKMNREEVTCCTLQILSGVVYLHSMGLAHRDLKLDNVVVNERGIMKIIDFGSAAVYRYPFENEIVLASGIVGSDPYLAPEVYDLPKYDPQPTDVWSLAIIFCCMTLRRFPWKQPRVSDNSYKLFVTEPTEEERRGPGYPTTVRPTPSSDTNNEANDNSTSDSHTQSAPPVIKGPWRLLRLLPRETRSIIGSMLEIDPKKRATLDDILSDPWVKRSFEEFKVCRQEVGEDGTCGVIRRAEGHEHVLEPGGGGTPAPSNQKGR